MDSAEILHMERSQDNYRIYNSMLVNHKNLSILGSEISMRIISELSREPMCAMDIVRNIDIDKQKVYYYLKKLEDSGIIRLVKNEQRHGMMAKVYGTVAPVISTKIYEDFREENLTEKARRFRDARTMRFFHPFIENGKTNSTIVVGDPYPHGKYDKGATETTYTIDFLLFMGKFIYENNFPSYTLDVHTNDETLKQNLIVFSNPKSNVVAEKINSHLPVYFDPEKEFAAVSKKTGKTYTDPRTGIIVKWDNPFCEGKKILFVAGVRSRGMRAAILALTKYFSETVNNKNDDGNLVRIVEGLDKTGDGIIDSIKILE
jgi:DNA-binding transcriptional ArsR family regulator